MKAQEISNILWAHGTLGIRPSKEYLNLLVTRANSLADEMDSRDKALLIIAISKLESYP